MSREDRIRSQVDLRKYGVSEVVMANAVLYAAEGVTPLFIDPEDALAARGWSVVIGIGGEVFVEPWGREAVYPCGLRPGRECLDLPGCEFWCEGSREDAGRSRPVPPGLRMRRE
jgi:hypothetical protein